MKNFLTTCLLLACIQFAIAGNFSTGVIDTTARANAAVAISKLDGGVASSNINVTGGTITGITGTVGIINLLGTNVTTTSTINTNKYNLNAATLFSSTAPTIASGFGTSPAISATNGNAAVAVIVGTGGVASTGMLTFPVAAHAWICNGQQAPHGANTGLEITGVSPTTVMVTAVLYSTGATTPFTANSLISLSCLAY
jgi:hypothetical protein